MTRLKIAACLSNEQIDQANHIAHKREMFARRTGSQQNHNLKASQERALEIHKIGVQCEMAARVVLGRVHWRAYIENKDDFQLPDLAHFIEVKGVDRTGQMVGKRTSLLVPTKAWKPERAYLSVVKFAANLFVLPGWLWSAEIKRYPVKEPNANRPAYIIPLSELTDTQELIKEARDRGATKTDRKTTRDPV